jgi:diguanylate cyclase (GGDEF)-like protein
MTEIIDCRGFEHPERVIGYRFNITGYELHERIYDHGKPQRINDTTGYPAFSIIIHYPIRSWLGLPLTVHDKVIGMLTLDSALTDHFTEDHMRLGKAFADQVAIALNHTQLYKREVRARERLTVLQHAVREIIAQSTAMPQLYSAIHHAVSQLMSADAFVIIIFDPLHEEIEYAYLADHGTIWPAERAPLPGSFADYMLRRREPLKINNFYEFTDFEFQIFGEPDDTNSGVAVLIHGRARVLGVLFTQSFMVDAYTNEDLAILELLAAHVATTLETAALFAEVTRLATIDSLTELPNRREFFRRAGQEIAQLQRTHRPLSMVMLDIDRFKQINDTHGHQVGDQVIQAIAAVCRSNLRPNDVAGRYGGEEIAILLPETNRPAAARAAERVRLAIEHLQISIGTLTITVTASLGVATTTTEDEQSLEELLYCADNALYLAKQRGRNQVVIWDATTPR